MKRRSIPVRAILRSALVCTAAALAGCNGPPSLDEPELVTSGPQTQRSAARAAAVRDMRARAEAAEFLDYPDVFADPVVDEPEPLPVREVVAVQTNLVGVARRRNAAYSPAEVAAGQARAAELRRLGRDRAAAAERAIRASGAPQGQ